jgi:(hydroxyamino)benzene mutase
MQKETNIQNKDYTEQHSRVLLVSGILLFLASLMNGFFIHGAALPRLALSAHLLGLIGSAMLLGLGSFWPRLNLSQKISSLGSILAIYGFCAGWLVYFSAAVSGAGGMFPMLGGRQGVPVMENLISVGMLTVALTLFTFGVIVITGLRAHNKS